MEDYKREREQEQDERRTTNDTREEAKKRSQNRLLMGSFLSLVVAPLTHTLSVHVAVCAAQNQDRTNPHLFLVFRKYFLQALGHEGLNNMLAAYEDKTAFAVCTFAYCAGPGHEPILFQGRCRGKIVPARGPPLFGSFHHLHHPPTVRCVQECRLTSCGDIGWDAVFEYEGQTYAEMDKDVKVWMTIPLPSFGATFNSRKEGDCTF